MWNDTQVVVDGADQKTAPSARRSPLIMGAVGLFVGVAFGLVVSNPVSEGEKVIEATTTLAGAASPVEPTNVGITEAVSGFRDALVAVALGDTDSLEHLLWPREGPLLEQPMYAGDQVAFDATAQHVAVTQAIREQEGVLLAVGRFNSVTPVATGVTSFAWHDTAAAHIGYTTVSGLASHLWHMTPDLRSREIATLDGEDWSLVAWGDWGWAAQQDNRLVLLDAEGEMTEQHAGVGVSSSSDGTILLVGPTMELVSAERGSRDLGVSGNLVGPIVDAVFSPDGRFVAISGREQTAILSLDDPEPGPVAEFDLLSAHGMAWTSDDAYVLVPTQAGVLLLDVGTGQVSRILERFRILAVDAVPVSRS